MCWVHIAYSRVQVEVTPSRLGVNLELSTVHAFVFPFGHAEYVCFVFQIVALLCGVLTTEVSG